MFNQVRFSPLSVTLGVALLATAITPLRASDLNKKTIATFTAPVKISGIVLPAGTYVFKTFSPEDRNLVVLTNREETHVIATLEAVRIEAPVLPEKARVELSEGTANSPEAVSAWFYPADSAGWAFPEPNADRNVATRSRN